MVNQWCQGRSYQKFTGLNGAFYMTSAEILRKYHTFIPEKTLPFIMPEERSINLDNIYDLYLLEALIQKGIVEI